MNQYDESNMLLFIRNTNILMAQIALFSLFMVLLINQLLLSFCLILMVFVMEINFLCLDDSLVKVSFAFLLMVLTFMLKNQHLG